MTHDNFYDVALTHSLYPSFGSLTQFIPTFHLVSATADTLARVFLFFIIYFAVLATDRYRFSA